MQDFFIITFSILFGVGVVIEIIIWMGEGYSLSNRLYRKLMNKSELPKELKLEKVNLIIHNENVICHDSKALVSKKTVIGCELATYNRYGNKLLIPIPIMTALTLIHRAYTCNATNAVQYFMEYNYRALDFSISANTLLEMSLYNLNNSIKKWETGETIYHENPEINQMAIYFKKLCVNRNITTTL